MKKEFKKYTRKNDHRFSLFKWIMMFFLLIIILVATGFFLYHYTKPMPLSSVFSNQVMKIESWFTERKGRLQKKLEKVSKVVTNKTEGKPEIHFEFYTTLPTIQIKPQADKKTTSLTKDVKLFDAGKLENSVQNEIHKSEK